VTRMDRVIDLLTEIRDLMRPEDEPFDVDENGRCLHPEEQRVILGHNEWICRRCRYQFSGVDHA
jgi:hypothetical protein